MTSPEQIPERPRPIDPYNRDFIRHLPSTRLVEDVISPRLTEVETILTPPAYPLYRAPYVNTNAPEPGFDGYEIGRRARLAALAAKAASQLPSGRSLT